MQSISTHIGQRQVAVQCRKPIADRDSGILVELTLIYPAFRNPANLATKSRLNLRIPKTELMKKSLVSGYASHRGLVDESRDITDRWRGIKPGGHGFGNKKRFPPQSHATSIGEVDFADLLLTRRGMARGEGLWTHLRGAAAMIALLYARPEWKFFGILMRADRMLAVAWWALLVLRAVMPVLFAIAIGMLVGRGAAW